MTERRTTKIAHISDLHFGAHDPRIVDALRGELNEDAPDLVVISGDLTQGGRRGEFRAARTFIDSLHAPALAVPGNHDITPYNLIERFLDPYARWRATISPETEPLWRNATVAVLGLNTARRAGLHWDWSRGRVTRNRLAGLLERLARLPAGMVSIVIAHHPFTTHGANPRGALVGGADRALEALQEAGVDLILSGHVHRSSAGSARSNGAGLLVVQAATTTSVRVRGEPNAYNRIAIDEAGRIGLQVRIWQNSGWITAAGSDSN